MTTQCSICFDDIENDNNKIITICNHAFHSTCLIKNIVMNGSDCPNCRKNLTGEENNNHYDDDEDYDDEEEEEYEENDEDIEFDINTFLSEEERMMQSILMEQNTINYNNSLPDNLFVEEDEIPIKVQDLFVEEDDVSFEVHPLHFAFIEFNKKNYDNFECIFKKNNINFKCYKGDYKFNNELIKKQDFMVSNCIKTLIEKLRSPNNLLYCIRGYKNSDKIYNVTSLFLFKNDAELELVTNDFDLVECNYDDFISNIKHKEEENLICEKYNIEN